MRPPVPGQPSSLPPAPHVARVRALYDAGQFCSAWDTLRAERPVEAWTSATERILLARVLMQIGSTRRSRRELFRAWEENPTDAEACQYHAMTLLQRRGPLAAMQFMDAAGSFETASEELRADWLLTRSNVSGALRDFVQAERWQRAAEALSPTHPWLWVQRAPLRMQGDAFAEAETWARKSLSLQPWYRPAVQQLAHLLQLQSRDDEALALLKEAGERLESGSVLGQLSALQGELGDDEGAIHSLWRALELSPGLERRGFEWFAGALSDAVYKLGDRARAVELAELSTHPWMKKVAARMATATDLRRVVLPVPFVRQHHVTCAPATLAALSAFWRMPADHVSVAEEICYDGTPARSERKWGNDHGFIALEFTVDWDSAVALLGRGIPFTLTTTETSTAHLQAIVGFDASRRTFLIRDPSNRFLAEADADAMFERYVSTGPRGMVLLPLLEAARLVGISLPDAALYDDLFAIQMALEAHDRARAGELQARMAASAPDHRLTIDAMLSLAGYDADRRARLRCAEQLVARYPDVPRLALMKSSYSQDLVSEPDRVAELEALALKPKADPDVLLAYATELSGDARRLPEADFLLRRGVRKSPESAQGYATLARVRHAQGRREEALVLRRAAACLAHKNERYAYQYFAEAQALGRVDEALAFLDDRFQRFGHKSGAACETLISALTDMDRTGDALNVLELGLQRARDDGDLRLAGLQSPAGC
ncbi:MAG: C39 family peptidase [Actinomycetota bacterium]|nr:C39 family peptidase [Actinomycetota bacterium]MDQ3265281.1 C39 family peptidase [Myxococcota bacterium]